MTGEFFFKSSELDKLVEKLSTAYKSADPFPHVVIDNFLPKNVLEEVLADFHSIPDSAWLHYRMPNRADKRECRDLEAMGPHARHFFNEINSGTFLKFLEKLTGIKGLIADPHFIGGGFHRIESEGHLGIHVDFNWYQDLKVDRRINMILFLNQEWHETWGGHLELWDAEVKNCIKKITPLFNRVVFFNTTDKTFHGYPAPIKCPPGMARKSIATYYYTNGRPEDEKTEPHKTIYKDAPTNS